MDPTEINSKHNISSAFWIRLYTNRSQESLSLPSEFMQIVSGPRHQQQTKDEHHTAWREYIKILAERRLR